MHVEDWSPPIILSAVGEDAHDPCLAVTSTGRVTIAWAWGPLMGIAGQVQVSVRDESSAAWSTPTVLSTTTFAYDPKVAVSPAGTTAVSWIQTDGAALRVYVATLAPDTHEWTAPAKLSASGELMLDAEAPQIVSSVDGTMTVAWSQWVETSREGNRVTRTRRVQVSTLLPGADHWSYPVEIPGADGKPQIASRHDNTVALTWATAKGGVYFTMRSTPEAEWSAAVKLSEETDTGFDEPQIDIAPDGTLAVVWTCRTQRSDQGNDAVKVSVRAPGRADWSRPTTVNETGEQVQQAQVAASGRGSFAAIWWRWEGGPYTPRDSRVNVSILSSGESVWSTPACLTDAAILAPRPQISATPSGDFVAVWCASDGRDRRAQFSKLALRHQEWSRVVNLSAAGRWGENPQVDPTSVDSVFATWTRMDGSHKRVEVSSLEPSAI